MNNAEKMREWLRIEAKHPDYCTKEEHKFARNLCNTGIVKQYIDYCEKVGYNVDFDEYFSNTKAINNGLKKGA